MYDRKTLLFTYGLSPREADFVEEYVREAGDVDEVMLPLIISNVRDTLRSLDRAFRRSYTLSSMRSDYNLLPEDIRAQYGDKYLLASLSLHNVDV